MFSIMRARSGLMMQLQVMSAIEQCRSAALSGHVERCENCGHSRIAYNSCRNRHCPKCQGAAAQDWLTAREADLLPVGYFHVVFTLPAEISPIVYQNKAVVYDRLEVALAEAEASAGETDAGLRRLDDALAKLERTEQHWYEAEMHRIRAEILLQRDPADNAAAEQALQTAIAIAQSQKARSFELRAALSLAKLYRAANRDSDVYAVLGHRRSRLHHRAEGRPGHRAGLVFRPNSGSKLQVPRVQEGCVQSMDRHDLALHPALDVVPTNCTRIR
jgi:hypothetical protein